MSVVYKYTLEWSTTLLMPKGAKVLCVQEQKGQAQLWALVEPNEQAQEARKFVCEPTGVPFDAAGLVYIGTFQMQGGSLVFHVFEDKR